jgi:hypothetical protein
MAKGWKVTVRPMTILEFMDDMSTVITDVSFLDGVAGGL